MKDRNPAGIRAAAVRPASWAAVVLAAVALVGCQPPAGEAPPEMPRNVRVLKLQTTDVEEYFEISGPVLPVRGATVSAQEGGTVFAVPHDKGDRVDEADVLVELDRRLLAADLAAARADLELRAFNADRTRQLFAAGKVSEAEKLTAETADRQAGAAAQAAELRWERAAVSAPFAGLVADRYVEPGELVAPGTPVARVIDPYTLKLAGAVTEREIALLREGAAAEVALDGHPDPVAGRVSWVGFEADPLTGKFKTEILVDNADLTLRSGVVGRARIHKRTHRGVIAVPRDAVMSNVAVSEVFVVEGDRAVRRAVTLGPDQGLMVVVLAGLAADELLVVRGQRELIDGALVSITEQAERTDGTLAGDPGLVTDAAANEVRRAESGEDAR